MFALNTYKWLKGEAIMGFASRRFFSKNEKRGNTLFLIYMYNAQ